MVTGVYCSRLEKRFVLAACACTSTAPMQSSPKDDPCTSKYQHSLPWALQNISPALAALHATRARALHLPHTFPDPLVSTHCTRCGTYLLDGMGTVRTIRKTKRAPGASRAPPAVSFSRKLRRVCNVCGHEEDIPLDNANTPFFPRVRRKAAEEQDTLVPTKTPAKAALVPREPTKPRSGSIKGSAASTPSRAQSVASAHSTPRNASPVSAPPPQGPSQFSMPYVPSANPPSASRTKARPKKKSGLQEMLARNRERQAEEKKSGASGGLAAFLDSL